MTGPDTAASDRAGRGRASAATAVCFWSVGNVIVAGFDLPGLQIGFWRLFLGAVVYGTFFYAGGRRITWATVRLVALPAVTIALEIALFFAALKNTSLANATTIGALQPILLMAVASHRYRERVTGWLVGIAFVAIGGVALVMFGAGGGSGGHLWGDLLAAVSTFFFAAYFVFVKDVRHHLDTFTLQTTSMAIGALVLLPLAAIDAGQVIPPLPSWSQWGWLALLLAVPGTGHFLMNWAHLHVSLTLTGLLTLAIPVLSAAGGWLVLDQRLTAVQVLGMVVVLSTLVVVVRRDSRMHAGGS
ncbi:MAG: EamA family transporter [Actinomycetota bacterium]|nr:EamA family transporter [Actinomycetota bacterium]